MSTKRICKKCEHWDKPDPDVSYGYCHRYPPSVDVEMDYPVVVKSDWCGEFKERWDD